MLILLKTDVLLCLYPIRLISSDKTFSRKVYVAYTWCFQLFHAVQAVRLTDPLCRLHYQWPRSDLEVIQSKHNQGSSTWNKNVKWTGPGCFVDRQMGRSRTLVGNHFKIVFRHSLEHSKHVHKKMQFNVICNIPKLETFASRM
jgi:hypothetical protein